MGYLETMSVLFYESPLSWGLQGDPYLWEELKRNLEIHPMPSSEKKLMDLLEYTFKNIVGQPITTEKDLYIEKYSFGGMSRGYISLEFWKEIAFPLLKQRYMEISHNEISKVLVHAKFLANKYKSLTGKPLGITGEVAEFTAATKLNLKLTKARQAGFDAIRIFEGREVKIQIKGRCINSESNSGRLGKIRVNSDWDVVMLVLLDEKYELISIYEAERDVIEKALITPGSRARNERGALSISQFKRIGKQII